MKKGRLYLAVKKMSICLALVLAVALSTTTKASAFTIERNDGIWLWPLSSSYYYASINDWNGDAPSGNCTLCGVHHTCTAHLNENAYGHAGLDIGAPAGSNVYAPADGTAYYFQPGDGGRGNTMIVEHPIGNGFSYYSVYQHLSGSNVSSGTRVSAGDTIAFVGNTGNSGGAHLHFGILFGYSGKATLSYIGQLENMPYLTTDSGTEGRILCNPGKDSEAGTPVGQFGCDENLQNHKGSVHYTFDKTHVSIGTSSTRSNEISLNFQGGTLTKNTWYTAWSDEKVTSSTLSSSDTIYVVKTETSTKYRYFHYHNYYDGTYAMLDSVTHGSNWGYCSFESDTRLGSQLGFQDQGGRNYVMVIGSNPCQHGYTYYFEDTITTTTTTYREREAVAIYNSVTVDANGVTAVLPTPEKSNAVFVCWNTKADGTGTNYYAGQNVTLRNVSGLYAIWKSNQTPTPTITPTPTVIPEPTPTPTEVPEPTDISEPIDISDYDVELSETEYTYSGSAKKPKITIEDLVQGTDYVVEYENNTKVGNAVVLITGIGDYCGEIEEDFYIVPKGTTISKLTSTENKIKVTYKKKTSQTTGYKVQVSTSSKFTASKTKTKTVKKNTTKTVTFTSLKANTTYYVRVRTYKLVDGERVYSEWSEVSKIKTK